MGIAQGPTVGVVGLWAGAGGWCGGVVQGVGAGRSCEDFPGALFARVLSCRMCRGGVSWAGVKNVTASRSGRVLGSGGFTLVELLVVISIIAVLVGILLPTLSRVRQQAVALRCSANMRQVGQFMAMYAVANRGWLYPPRSGANVRLQERWMVSVIKPDRLPEPPTEEAADYTPKILLCPADSTDVVLEPSGMPYLRAGQTNVHSYVLSLNLGDEEVTFSKRDLGGLTPGTLAIMGEKFSTSPAYYLGTRPQDPSDYRAVLEFYRHGRPGAKSGSATKPRGGSNYLFLDLHVEPMREIPALRALDPWNFLTLRE